MAERPLTPSPSRFQTAIEELTDGLSQLVRQHFELARSEVRREASALGRDLLKLAVFGVLAFVGYGALNLAILGVALWAGGIAAMAITAIALAVVQLSIGGIGATQVITRLQQDGVGLPETSQELQKDKQWLKEIRDSSSDKRLPEQTS